MDLALTPLPPALPTRPARSFTNPGAISHNEILQLYKDHVDPEFSWENFTLEEQAKVGWAVRRWGKGRRGGSCGWGVGACICSSVLGTIALNPTRPCPSRVPTVGHRGAPLQQSA